MGTSNAINLHDQGIAYYNGSADFTAPTIPQYDVVIGSTANNITAISPSATSGVPLISQGSSSNPAFGTAVVAGGGTGLTSTTAYGVICGGTGSTASFQNAGAGSSGQILVSGGASSLPAFTSMTVNIQAFASNGTYTPTTNMKYCQIECIGGGGGSGGVATTGDGAVAVSGGGGGGGYGRDIFTSSTIGASQSVTIGAAGTAGAAGNNNGGTGGTTSVGILISSTGGVGGSGGAAGTGGETNGGGAGGSSSATINANGGAGFAGIGVGAVFVQAGNGGSTFFGGGAVAQPGAPGVAQAGASAGGGASGAALNANASQAAGAAGAKGAVYITEWCW